MKILHLGAGVIGTKTMTDEIYDNFHTRALYCNGGLYDCLKAKIYNRLRLGLDVGIISNLKNQLNES